MSLWYRCYPLKKGTLNSWAANKQNKCSVEINLLISDFKNYSNSFEMISQVMFYQMKYSEYMIKETFEQPSWLSG